jgi:ATP-binding cassette, subfamily B, bacterial
MQGKPPPGYTGQGPQAGQGPQGGQGPQAGRGPQQATPPGQTPQPFQQPSDASALRGMAPPAGADGKPKGRGGAGAQLRDVRWGMIFGLGWKLMNAFKVLVIGYALMTLVMNVVTMGTSQIIGEITNTLQGLDKTRPAATQSAAAAQNPAPAATTPAAPATNADTDPNAQTRPKAPPKERSGPAMVLLWSGAALLAMLIRLPMKALSTKLDAALSNRMRSQLFARMLRQSPEFYHQHETGELNAVVNQMTVEASITLRQVGLDSILAVITLVINVGALIYNFDMDPKPTLFGKVIPAWLIPLSVTLFAFISPWLTTKMANALRDVSRGLQEKMVALNSLVTGAMQSPEEIQAMKAEPMFMAKHERELGELAKAKVKNAVTVEYMGLFSGLPSWIVEVAMLTFAVYFAYASRDAAAAGKVVAIFLLTPQLMTPIQGLSAYILMAGNAWPAIETVNGMMASKARRDEKSGTVKVDSVEPTIVAKNVTFAYTPAGRKIFDDISFELPPGKITGFVAKMGQGKTTFFKLALRFYDPERGQILLGGRPVVDYASDNLYNHIAMMSQFPAFFYDTLRANMQMANQDATDEEIRAICEKTGVWKILEASVGGQGNPLDQEFAGGRRLSGGQKKLLALTRCLLRNPSVLFLDEPTVGMDNKEKFSMLEIIKNALKDRTVMVVDHDLRWLVPFCNYFIVLDNGKIAEQGTAEELLARRGLFSELYNAESSKPETAAQAGPPPGAMAQMAQGQGRRPPGA